MQKSKAFQLNNIVSTIKGVVVAGGHGTRLYPLTLTTPKALLPVGGKAMILYAVQQLAQAGITDIYLVIQKEFATQFKQIVGNRNHLGGINLQYVWHPSTSSGMPMAINLVRPNINTDEKIVVVCADVIIEKSLASVVKQFAKQTKGARMLLAHMNDASGFTPAQVKADQVTRLLSKDINRHQPGLVDIGVYMYPANVFSKINHLTKKHNSKKDGEVGIWELNRLYVQDNQMKYSQIDSWWSDVGLNLETYYAVNSRYEKK